MLSRRVSFVLLMSMAVSFLAGSSAVSPLYPLYQAQWGFSPITTTAIFGIYAVAVLCALLVFGALSDHVGRTPVLLVSVLIQVVTMILFARAGSVLALFVARVVQGLSTGAAVGAIGAGLLDLDRSKGTLANAVAPVLGTATGGLVSGLALHFLPMPTTLVFLVLGAVFVVQAGGVLLVPETAAPRPGAWASLRPRLQLPPRLRPAMLTAAPLLVAAWATVGFYGSLGPGLVKQLSGATSLLWGGLSVFTFAASGAAAVFALRSWDARPMTWMGAAGLLGAVGASLFAVHVGSAGLIFAASVLGGIGFGAAFQGAIRSVVPHAAAHERAGVLSVVYIVSYLAMGVPAVLGGLCVVYGGGLEVTAVKYGLAVAALVAVAIALRLRTRSPVAVAATTR
jgi:MFS family permease